MSKPSPFRRGGGTNTTAMRIIVPLQGVVQGKGGLFLGSVIPCALFYIFQLYFKPRHHRSSSPPPSPTTTDNLSSLLPRSLSRTHLSPTGSGSTTSISARANSLVQDSSYDVASHKAVENHYHQIHNPDGVIHLGVDHSNLCVDLVRDWMEKNVNGATILREGGNCNVLNIAGIAPYLPFDGLMELKTIIQHLEWVWQISCLKLSKIQFSLTPHKWY